MAFVNAIGIFNVPTICIGNSYWYCKRVRPLYWYCKRARPYYWCILVLANAILYGKCDHQWYWQMLLILANAIGIGKCYWYWQMLLVL